MNTVEALKELYKSFGGKMTDTYDTIADGIPVGNYSVIPDCFAALAEIAGGSIELPVVTQADAGDVLTVGENGKWTNAEPSKELPTVTASDDGSVLSVVDGAWAKGLKIKKKQVSTEVKGTAINYLEFKLNSNNNDTQILGVMFTPETLAKISGVYVEQKIVKYGSFYGYADIRLRYDTAGTSYLEQGTYTLNVYYIEE